MDFKKTGQEVEGPYTPAVIPDRIRIGSMLLSIITLGITAVCIGRRWNQIKRWRQMSLARMLLLGVYVNSFVFVCSSVIMKDLGTNLSPLNCTVALWFCLTLYMNAKILVYFFLVEKSYIVRASKNPRMKDKIYLWTCFGVMLPLAVIYALIIYWRIGYINKEGSCIIGIGRQALIPLIIFDVIINIYMTALFVMPLRKLYSYKNNSSNGYLRTVALRTFIGSLLTLVATITNVTALSVTNGEAGWLCMMTCNSDVLFSVVVLHWVTSTDQKEGGTTTDNKYAENSSRRAGRSMTSSGKHDPSTELEDLDRDVTHHSSGTTYTICTAGDKETADSVAKDKSGITYEREIKVEGDDRKTQRSLSRTGSRDEILPSSYHKRTSSDGASDNV